MMMCVIYRRTSRTSFETTLDKRNGLCFAHKFDNSLAGPVGFWTGYVSVYCAVVLCVRKDRFSVSERPKVKWRPRNRVLQIINTGKWLPSGLRKEYQD